MNLNEFIEKYDKTNSVVLLEGGTGHTINTCKELNVPVIDQIIWFGWL